MSPCVQAIKKPEALKPSLLYATLRRNLRPRGTRRDRKLNLPTPFRDLIEAGDVEMLQ